MPRPRVSPSTVVIMAPPRALGPLLALALLLGGSGACQRGSLPGTRPQPASGAAELAFHGPTTVETIDFALTGPAGVDLTGQVASSGGSATATIPDLPEGNGYLATASARATDGARCAGSSAPFSITADRTTAVPLSLVCTAAGNPIDRIGHIVVIYMENHSFDSLYGSFPGVEGLSSPAAAINQIDDATGLPYLTLPSADPSIPADLPNRPFDLSLYVPADQTTIDLVHRFYQQQQQINGGRMDRFVTVSDARSLTVAYYPTEVLPVAQLALAHPTQATICDHFFHAAFGGSFLNHHWLIAAATPVFPNAPASLVVTLDAAGNLVTDGSVTPDGFVVNALEPAAGPHAAGAAPESLVPPQLAPTIGDRLSAAGVDWAWYAGGWDAATGEAPDPAFVPAHQPFAYYAGFGEGTAARAAHLKDDDRLEGEIASGTLPPVAFVKPASAEDEHPSQSTLLAGQRYAVALIERLMASPLWSDTVVILTYDENGGFWDHVPPPIVDRWGPGTRVPALVFSPFASGGVDATVYDTTAILKLIETRWNLPPLGVRDAAQPDLSVHALRLPP
jgi:phospholipase C